MSTTIGSSIGGSGGSHRHHEPLCELRVADSVFLGFVCTHPTLASVEHFRQELMDRHHPNAAHVPYAASLGDGEEEGYDDDDEPTGSGVGKALLRELQKYKKQLRRQSTIKLRGSGKNMLFESDEEDDGDCGAERQSSDCQTPVATAIIVVRYFEKRLLGVTCGRLRAVYERTARLALHRHLNGRDKPFTERFAFREGYEWSNLYGLGAGDTELILNVVPEDDERAKQSSNSIVDKLTSELQFEGMVGSKNEVLPRLQNLQADLPFVCGSIVPIYRYPGNYSGLEWPTHHWSPTTLAVKKAVEEALQPLYVQHMNHCVTNLYRDGTDKIDRHSDKDLDLNREGVIVSVSLGAKRVMEVRDRQYPHDVAHVELPPNSMFVLGPYTNARFTHAILPSKESHEEDIGHSRRVSFFCSKPQEHLSSNAVCSVGEGGRVSLTFRDVRTFLDVKTQRLFTPVVKDGFISGESLSKAVQNVREADRGERRSAALIAMGLGTTAGYAALSAVGSGKERTSASSDTSALLRSVSTAVIFASASYWSIQQLRSKARHQREEKEARVFFSKKSASGNVYFQ
ncbi:hypothetical protein ACHAXT_006059 [Thalassiosira profunda]